MTDDCLMKEDCPAYDPDLKRCLIRPGDCDFRSADDEAVLTFETPEALPLDASAEVRSPTAAQVMP